MAKTNGVNNAASNLIKTVSARDLIRRKFYEMEFIVDGIIPNRGLTVFASAPKNGKSTISMMISLAAANSQKVFGAIRGCQTKVLYIALEDGDQRLHDRLIRLSPDYEASGNLDFATYWNSPKQDGVSLLSNYLAKNPDIGFVVIDTYARFLGASQNGKAAYKAEYEASFRIKEIADEHDIAVLLIHHTIKAVPKDWLAGLYGSFALVGVADTVLYLERERGSNIGVLHATGRDIEDISIGLKLNKETGLWEMAGNYEEVFLSPERREILEVLRASSAPLKLDKIAQAIGKKKNNAHSLLKKLIGLELVEKAGHGLYRAADTVSKSKAHPVEPVEAVNPVNPVNLVNFQCSFAKSL